MLAIAHRLSVSRRRHEYELGTRLVRKVSAVSFQARGWVFEPNIGSVNLGLFRGAPDQDPVVGERKANAVAREYERRWLKLGQDPLEAFLEMRRDGRIKATLTPPGAKWTPNGWLPCKYLPKIGTTVVGRRTYATPEAAARVLVDWVRENMT